MVCPKYRENSVEFGGKSGKYQQEASPPGSSARINLKGGTSGAQASQTGRGEPSKHIDEVVVRGGKREQGLQARAILVA